MTGKLELAKSFWVSKAQGLRSFAPTEDEQVDLVCYCEPLSVKDLKSGLTFKRYIGMRPGSPNPD